MPAPMIQRHSDGAVTVTREIIPGLRVAATNPIGDQLRAEKAAYAEEVRVREVIRRHGLADTLIVEGLKDNTDTEEGQPDA